MKNQILLSIFIIISISGLILSKSADIKPLNSKNKILVSESGKKKTYYLLQEKDPSVILVKGPGKLKVNTIARITNKENTTNYTLYYIIDGGKETAVNFNKINASKKIKFIDNKNSIAALKQQIIVELGPGEHTLSFHKANEKPEIIASYIFSKSKIKKLNWVMLSSSPANEPVDLVTHENVIHYYRFSEKNPLKIKIIGPTLLRVLTRFEIPYKMKGRIDYRLQLKENKNVIHTYLLGSTFSDVTTYKSNDSFIPAKAKEFYIEVPSGKHIYTLVPLDKGKNSILARVLFPKKDVKLED